MQVALHPNSLNLSPETFARIFAGSITLGCIQAAVASVALSPGTLARILAGSVTLGCIQAAVASVSKGLSKPPAKLPTPFKDLTLDLGPETSTSQHAFVGTTVVESPRRKRSSSSSTKEASRMQKPRLSFASRQVGCYNVSVQGKLTQELLMHGKTSLSLLA